MGRGLNTLGNECLVKYLRVTTGNHKQDHKKTGSKTGSTDIKKTNFKIKQEMDTRHNNHPYNRLQYIVHLLA